MPTTGIVKGGFSYHFVGSVFVGLEILKGNDRQQKAAEMTKTNAGTSVVVGTHKSIGLDGRSCE